MTTKTVFVGSIMNSEGDVVFHDTRDTLNVLLLHFRRALDEESTRPSAGMGHWTIRQATFDGSGGSQTLIQAGVFTYVPTAGPIEKTLQ